MVAVVVVAAAAVVVVQLLLLEVVVNGAYKHGIYERICLANLRILSNVNLFTTQSGRTANSTLVDRTNTTHYIDLGATHKEENRYACRQ